MGEIILVFTPTWIDPITQDDAILPEVEAALKAQELRAGSQFDWHVTTDNPYPREPHADSHRNVLHQYQRAREWFLNASTPYSALLTLEHDNLLPDPGALQRLLDTPGDLVYAPYLLRHGAKMVSTWQYINDRNLGMSLTNYPVELRQAREQVVHRISGAGFGCTLIRRHVLEALEFTGRTDRDRNWCPDLRFAEDCLRKGFVSNGRFDVPVMHRDRNDWLHPYQNRRNGVALYLPLETMNALAAGRFIALQKDVPIQLSAEEASELSRLGVIQSLPSEAPKPDETAVAPEQGPRRHRAKTLKG